MARHNKARKSSVSDVAVSDVAVSETSVSGEAQMDTNANVEDMVVDNGVDAEDVEVSESESVSEDEVFDRPFIDVLAPDASYELLPDNVKNRYSETERAALLALVEIGAIKREKAKVTIAKKTSTTKRDEVQPFYAYVPQTNEAMLAQCNGKMERASKYEGELKTDADAAAKEIAETRGVIDYFFYGHDLEIRNWIRQSLSASLAGPLLSIAKTVQSMLKQKNASDVADALDTIAYGLKKKGKTLPADITEDAVKKFLKIA